MARDDARSSDRVVLAIAWRVKRAVSASISGVRNGKLRVDHGYVVHDREVLCDDVDVSRSSSRRTSTA